MVATGCRFRVRGGTAGRWRCIWSEACSAPYEDRSGDRLLSAYRRHSYSRSSGGIAWSIAGGIQVAGSMAIWQYAYMTRVKTTLSIDEDLIRQVRIRAARAGRTQSEVLEAALREGLGVIERIRAKARLSEDEALDLASQVVHDVRSRRGHERNP